MVTTEEKEDGILTRPAVVVPVERYSPERKAEFLLSNAIDEADCRSARKAVRNTGLDPDRIPHAKPSPMDRLFLGVDVLFSAAYNVGARVFRLWQPKDVLLYSSPYALEEARFNLAEENRQRSS